MKTFLKFEALSKTFELEIKLIDGKQVIAIELADILAILGEKPAKPLAVKGSAKAGSKSGSAKPAKKRYLM